MDCKERYADSLLCCDVLDIHVYVKARLYKTWHFAEYTMILGGTYDAGRFDSYSEVQLICFSKASSNFAIKNNTIQPLAQQVRGRSDTGWFTYLLKFQDHCPELCYLRHLLVFVHCMHLEGAAEDTHLFPEKTTLMEHTPDSIEVDSYLEGLHWSRKKVMENSLNPLDLFVGCSQAFCLHVPSTDARYRSPGYFLLDLSSGKIFTAKPPGDQHFRSVVESLPIEFRNKVIEGYNLHTTQQEHCQQTWASPLAMNTFTTVQVSSSPSLLQVTTGQLAGHFFVPIVLVPLISNLASDPRRYEVPLKAHHFGAMNSSKQALFLFQAVRDLITLGEFALRSVPGNTVRCNEQAAHLCLRRERAVFHKKLPF